MSDIEARPETRTTEAKRLDAFVDAAFAFAVTMLLIAGAEPLQDVASLKRALLQIPASGLSFALVALFWATHRAYGQMAPRRDGYSTLLSLCIVFAVLVYVFPLRLLVSSGLFYMTGGLLPGSALISSYGDLQALYIVYGLGYALLAGLYVLLFRHSVKKGAQLGVSPEDRIDAGHNAAIWSLCALTGVVSALVAVFVIRQAPWAPGFAYWLIPVLIYGRAFLVRRKAAKPPPAEPA